MLRTQFPTPINPFPGEFGHLESVKEHWYDASDCGMATDPGRVSLSVCPFEGRKAGQQDEISVRFWCRLAEPWPWSRHCAGSEARRHHQPSLPSCRLWEVSLLEHGSLWLYRSLPVPTRLSGQLPLPGKSGPARQAFQNFQSKHAVSIRGSNHEPEVPTKVTLAPACLFPVSTCRPRFRSLSDRRSP
ncbi:hypothetical protein VTI28DRAFT_4004 [Corynascus sepedonium]